MAHVRQQIRDAVIAALKAEGAFAARVYGSRSYTLSKPSFPAAIVYTQQETSARSTMGEDGLLTRQLTVSVQIYQKMTGKIDDMLDALAARVEPAIASDSTLNSLAHDVQITSTDIQIMTEAEQPVGVLTANYDMVYYTNTNTPETIA